MNVLITSIFLFSLARAGGSTTSQSLFGDDDVLTVLRGTKKGFKNEQDGNAEATSMLAGEAFVETLTTNWLDQGGVELRKEKHTEEADIHVDEVRDKKTSSASLVVSRETGVSSSSKNSMIVPLVVGPYISMPFTDFDLLKGYKIDSTGGFTKHLFTAETKYKSWITSYTLSKVISSAKDSSNMLEVSGGARISYMNLLSGDGEVKYLKTTASSDSKISVLYRSRHIAFAKVVDERTMKALGLLDVSSQDIMDKYGTMFVDKVLYGAQLDVRYDIESTSSINVQEIEAELKGQIGIGPISGGFKGRFESKDSTKEAEYSLRMEAKATGVNFVIEPQVKFDDMNEIIKKFNSMYVTEFDKLKQEVGQGQDIGADHMKFKGFSPIGFTLQSLVHHTVLNSHEVKYLNDKMNSLSEIYYSAFYLKSELERNSDEMAAMYGKDPQDRAEIFEPYEDKLLETKDQVVEVIEKCLVYMGKGTKEMLDTDLPSVEGTPVPEALSNTYDMKTKGLLGQAYIVHPTIVPGGKDYDGVTYVGYVLETDGVFYPWMGGLIRTNDVKRTLLAKADTPKELQENLEKYYEGPKPPLFDKNNWDVVVGKGTVYSSSKGDAFLKLSLAISPNKIVYRYCENCYSTHQNIFYKRLTDIPKSMNLLDVFMTNWVRTNNQIGVDFNLYSSYEDALDERNAWTFCMYRKLSIGFPGVCGPDSYTSWQWNSWTKTDGQKNVAFYVEPYIGASSE